MHPSVPSPSAHRLRVLVADDHPVVRAGMVALLERESDMEVVFEADDGAQAVRGWRACLPDVGLIDLSMPVVDGFAAVASIRSTWRQSRLVVMTSLSGDEDVYRALQAGASGYLLKDCGRAELLACIRAVARGEKYFQQQASARLAERIGSEDLTAREADVLRLLTEGLSNKAVALRLGVAEGTVKTHVKGVLAKLGVRSRTQAVALGLRRGLVRRPFEDTAGGRTLRA